MKNELSGTMRITQWTAWPLPTQRRRRDLKGQSRSVHIRSASSAGMPQKQTLCPGFSCSSPSCCLLMVAPFVPRVCGPLAALIWSTYV